MKSFKNMLAIGGLATLAGIGTISTKAQAQDYPTRPITMIVPFAAGGPTDVIARIVASDMSKTLGIKVTVIEPGGFRTDFAGSSTAIYEGRPEYAETVGAMADYQRNYNGRQPGDPARAAAAVLHIASLDTPPLRLLLGSDAAAAVEKADAARMEADRIWRVVSQSTDFEQSGDARPMPWDKKAG